MQRIRLSLPYRLALHANTRFRRIAFKALFRRLQTLLTFMDMEYQKDKIIVQGPGCEARGAAEPHSRSKPSPTDSLFIIGNGIGIRNKEVFYKYFPLLTNRSSKSLYQLLLVVFSNPLRSETTLRGLILGNCVSTRKNIAILCDLGYIQQENKPRKIIAFEAYTIDKVYRITAKGVKVLSAITGY